MVEALERENFTRELKRFERAIEVIDREQSNVTDIINYIVMLARL